MSNVVERPHKCLKQQRSNSQHHAAKVLNWEAAKLLGFTGPADVRLATAAKARNLVAPLLTVDISDTSQS